MHPRAQSSAAPRLVLALAAVLLAGCVTVDVVPREFEGFEAVREAAQDSAPLGGEALAQRKLELERAYADIVHFDATLSCLDHRRDRNGALLFKGFLDAYLGTHVDPMLHAEWQSRHPELSVLDANLRFAKAELLIRLRATSRAQDTIDEIARRYAGRDDMLVAFPFGKQSRLSDGLKLLRDRKWRG
jgi:hypothetical protein